MPFSIQLENIIQEGIKIVNTSQDNHLPLFMRIKIWDAIGERKTKKQNYSDCLSWKWRFLLSKLCVEYSLCVWEEYFPNSDIVDGFLNLMNEFIAGNLSVEEVSQKRYNFDTGVAFVLSEFNWAGLVAFAAQDALSTAQHDGFTFGCYGEQGQPVFDCPDFAKNETDFDIDSWDAAFCACVAYADGPPYSEDSVSEKRREFWLWYLQQAIGQALELAQEI